MEKWGIWAVRSSSSILGAAEGWCKDGNKEIEVATEKEAIAMARYFGKLRDERCMDTTVQYFAKERD